MYRRLHNDVFKVYTLVHFNHSFSVRLVIDEMGFIKTPDEDETSNLIWCDAAVQQEKITELRNYQVGLSLQLFQFQF